MMRMNTSRMSLSRFVATRCRQVLLRQAKIYHPAGDIYTNPSSAHFFSTSRASTSSPTSKIFASDLKRLLDSGNSSNHSGNETRNGTRSTWIEKLLLATLLSYAYIKLSHELSYADSKNQEDQYFSIRLCAFAKAGNIKGMRDLLEQNPHIQDAVNRPHVYGWTPLIVAAANGQLESVKFLIEHGANLEIGDKYRGGLGLTRDARDSRLAFHPELRPDANCLGWTALHYAVAYRHMDVINALIEAGANLDAKNGKGKTPENCINWIEVPDAEPYVKTIQALFTDARRQRKEKQERLEREERIRFPLETKLRAAMVGQLMPIFSVASAIRRRQNGWYDANKPLVFLFLGSSGVGKTMLAKLLAEHVVKDADDGFIRIDMSEYQTKHEMARLIGSPPGYVGHEQGGQLTTKLAKCPEAVVLLDEVEKAHPDVLALMLQVFDEGRLTDGQGQTIHCPNAIFIMTSNLVQSEIRNAIDDGRYKLRLHTLAERGEILKPSLNILRGSTPLIDALSATSVVVPPVAVSSALHGNANGDPNSNNEPKETDPTESWSVSEVAAGTDSFIRRMVYPILKKHFKREEFIGRINDIVVFHPLSDSDLKDTVNTELNRWKTKAMDRHGIEIRWTDALVESLQSGYDERYGYRSIIYAVEKRVVNVLAAAHECEMIYPQCTVELDVVRDEEAEKLCELQFDPILGSFDRVIIRSVKPRDNQPSDSNTSNSARKKLFGLF